MHLYQNQCYDYYDYYHHYYYHHYYYHHYYHHYYYHHYYHHYYHRRPFDYTTPLLSLLGGPLQQPARWGASWYSMPPQGSSVTGGSMTTSHRSSVMFSTGCQSHSASSTSSAYSSFFHFTELLQSTYAIAVPGLIPLRPDYGYHHWRGLISVCGG